MEAPMQRNEKAGSQKGNAAKKKASKGGHGKGD
jgi:hypothetical protein